MSDQVPGNDRWVRDAVERYERPLVSYALRIVGNLETAREVVQDTFLKLCDQPIDEVEGHLAPWLFTVCRNRALDVARKEKPMTPLTSENTFVRPSQASDPGAGLEQAEMSSRLGQALARLPKGQQEVIRLKFQSGLSCKDIAKVTNLTPSYVGYLIHMGIKAMREHMVV